jgi:hypothetical protein
VFIASARAAVPALIAEARRLKAENAALKQAYQALRSVAREHEIVTEQEAYETGRLYEKDEDAPV